MYPKDLLHTEILLLLIHLLKNALTLSLAHGRLAARNIRCVYCCRS
jgi:hypothetical protein